jgi:molybdate transport system regulatory protein
MNRLAGKIYNIKSDKHLSIIEMDVNGDTLKTIIIETESTVGFLKKGTPINLMFKETEVSIAKDFSGKISLQNKMECIIKEIKKGFLLSSLILDYNGNQISSVITSAAVEQLSLEVGDKVTALVKTNEIIIAPDD